MGESGFFSMRGLFLFLIFILLINFASALGVPGSHCGATGDPACRLDLVCLYNTCLAKPFALCSSTADCAGTATNLMECYNSKCYGRHGYPCGDEREDDICSHNPADSFHCDISGTLGYNYCEQNHDSNETIIIDLICDGNIRCSEERCNIGHSSCLSSPPAKEYTIREGQKCTFSGTITNSGCAWKNPATLIVSGNGCSKTISYSDCEIKSFSFTCNPGAVSLSADDSSYFTLSYSCQSINYSYCGDGILDYGEECENSADCSSGKICSACKCISTTGCGDGFVNNGEQCDNGVKINGIPCIPPVNGTCSYCTSNCTLASVRGGSCGNGVVDYGELCDQGPNNGKACTAFCGSSCVYCNTNCTVSYVNSEPCDKNYTYYQRDEYYLPLPYYSGYSYGARRASVCGDGIVGLGEDCDRGKSNGVACKPGCNSDCEYCSSSCKLITLQGNPCVRRPRPWEQVTLCREILIPPNIARLDDKCGGNNNIVTSLVEQSDDNYAEQSSCQIEPSSIYLYWYALENTGWKNISLLFEHSESYANVQAEYYDGASWIKLCDAFSSRNDIIESCAIKNIADYNNISLRLRIGRTGSQASYARLDSAFISLTYCSTGSYACGNGIVEMNEECDDGNVANGDSCSSICNIETWNCGSWGTCSNGMQSQICNSGQTTKTNTKSCGGIKNIGWILLLLILIFLILLFIFFPIIYGLVAAGKKKKK